jgi:hypothetical protein
MGIADTIASQFARPHGALAPLTVAALNIGNRKINLLTNRRSIFGVHRREEPPDEFLGVWLWHRHHKCHRPGPCDRAAAARSGGPCQQRNGAGTES